MADVPVRDEPYIGKVPARYRDLPSRDQQCSVCSLFTQDTDSGTGDPIATGTCKVVIGRVYVQGWCRYFSRVVDGGVPMRATLGVAPVKLLMVALAFVVVSCASPPPPAPVVMPPPPPTVPMVAPVVSEIPPPTPSYRSYHRGRYHYYRTRGHYRYGVRYHAGSHPTVYHHRKNLTPSGRVVPPQQ